MYQVNENISDFEQEQSARAQEVFDDVQQKTEQQAEKGSLASILSQATNIGLGTAQLLAISTRGTAAEKVFTSASNALRSLREKLDDTTPDESLFGQLSGAVRSGAAEGGLRGAVASAGEFVQEQAQTQAQAVLDEAAAAAEPIISDTRAQAEDMLNTGMQTFDETSSELLNILSEGRQVASQLQDSASGQLEIPQLAPTGQGEPLLAAESQLFEYFRPGASAGNLGTSVFDARPAADEEFGDEMLADPRMILQSGGFGKSPQGFAGLQRAARGIDVAEDSSLAQMQNAAQETVGTATGQAASLLGDAAQETVAAGVSGQAEGLLGAAQETVAAGVSAAQETVGAAVGAAQETVGAAVGAAQEAAGAAVGAAQEAVGGVIAGISAELAPFAGPLALAVGVGAGIYSLVEEIRGALQKHDETAIQAATPISSYTAPTS